VAAMGRLFTRLCLGFATLAGCSTAFDPQPCSVDSDCGSGLVCELREQRPVCVDSSDAPIVIGSSSAITGTNQALGTGMKLGIELALKEQNDAGGIRGRQIKLEFRDDGYTPTLAEAATKQLIDVQTSQAAPRCPTTSTPVVAGDPPLSSTALDRGPNAVIAILGSVGTPTMVRSAPVAIETGTIYFGAFTGAASILRDDKAGACKQYIFNVRASYGQEARATVEYFRKKGVAADYKHWISFDQNDTFGQAGYDGLVQGYREVVGNFPGSADPTNPIVRFRYARNDDASVPAQVNAAAAYLASSAVLNTGGSEVHSVGIMMTDTYGAGAAFIQGLREWQMNNDAQQTSLQKATRLKLYFSNVSFVGPNELSARLANRTINLPSGGTMAMSENVVVSQVVPNYQSDTSDVVVAYNRLVAQNGAAPGFTSLEGYVSTRVFIAGLLAHKGPFVPAELVKTFEKLPDLSLGIGASSGYSMSNHQYSNSVWGTIIQPDGAFRNLYFWSQGQPIQFFE
jgi:branched-chain amino acid transport system substrate-binding protein